MKTREQKLIEQLWDALSGILEDPLCAVTNAHRRAGIKATNKAWKYQYDRDK